MTYEVTLHGKSDFVYEHTAANAWLSFISGQIIRWEPTIADIADGPFKGELVWTVRVKTVAAASTTPVINAVIFQKNATPPLYGTPWLASVESYDYLDTLDTTNGNDLIFTFNLDSVSPFQLDFPFFLTLGVNPASPAATFAIRYSNVEADADFDLYQFGTPTPSVWNSVTGELLSNIAGYREKDFDITPYVRNVTTDAGKSDVDGRFVEGEAEITLANNDERFSPYRDDFDISPYWDVNQEVTITQEYLSTVYPLFKGFIQRIRPDQLFDDKTAQVMLSDWFTRFKKVEGRLSGASTFTAHALIQYLLENFLDFDSSMYDLDTTDTTILANPWGAEVKSVFDFLEEIVEAGAGSHFVGADGVYYFRSGNWKATQESPDYSLTLDIECPDVDDFKIEHDIKGLVNQITVQGATGDPAEIEDPASIKRYGVNDLSIDSDVIPDNGYAETVALRIYGTRSQRVRGSDIVLAERYPTILTAELGDVVNLDDATASGVSQDFEILNIHRDIQPAGAHEVTFKMKAFYPPPYQWENREQTDKYNTTMYFRDNYFGQQFVAPYSGQLRFARALIETHGVGSYVRTLTVRIMDAFPLGNPVGDPSADTNWIALASADNAVTGVWPRYVGHNAPQLVKGNTYVIRFDISKPLTGFYKVIGEDTSPDDGLDYYYYKAGQTTVTDFDLGVIFTMILD